MSNRVSKKYDLISIGDCTTDAFIKLHDASVHCDLNHEHCQLCLSFADKVPYEDLTVVAGVGNASNVAVGGARLGLRSAAFTAIGKDHFGSEILKVYQKEKVGREFVKINPGKPTNYHFVLTFQAERTILIKHQDFQYYDPDRLRGADWLYFSSMGEHSASFHHKLGSFLQAHKNLKMGFNPGTFQLKMGPKKLAQIYRNTHVLFVNRQEARRILGTASENIKTLFRGLHKLGPRLAAITDGPAGSYASDGAKSYFMPIYPDPKAPVERTGAGDAFASGFISALIYGLPLTAALRWAPINSMAVVQKVGAQKGLLKKAELMRLLGRAPKAYQPREI